MRFPITSLLRVLSTALVLSSSFALHAQTLAKLESTGKPSQAADHSLPIKVTPESSNSQNVSVKIPSTVNPDTLSIVLNGHDVTSRFGDSECEGTRCKTAVVTEADGLHDGKNLIYAAAKGESGVATSRVRFDGSPARPATRTRINSTSAVGGVRAEASSLPTASNFLPPTIAFSTLGQGGVGAGQPWIQLGDQIQLSTASGCSEMYSVIALDRQTLTQTTPAQCINDGQALQTALASFTSEDLVIVGTNYGFNTDANSLAGNFDTSAIGGTAYNCVSSTACPNSTAISADVPLGYIAIGAGGAAPGTAFENYYTSLNATATVPGFNGMLVEDPWGNYNYQPAGAIEFWTNPLSAANGGVTGNSSTVTISQISASGLTGYPVTFTVPGTGGVGGYWLLKLDRTTLAPAGTYSVTKSINDSGYYWLVSGAGNYYQTGSTDTATATQAFISLSNDLQSTKRDQLAILVTAGQPLAVGVDAAAALSYTNNGTTQYAYYGNFALALQLFGVPDRTTLGLGASTSAYSLVSCYSCGDPLVGNAALSTTVYSQQGQTGAMHGLLEPDLHGMYWPVRSAQITTGTDTADYSLDETLSQPPVEWPELNGTLLSGASSVAGQVGAYHYLSYMLVTQYYIVGAQGNYLDDIHYYFAGTNNTYLNYHTFDPTQVAAPTPANNCTWIDPVSTTCYNFTAQDQAAVASQLKTELVYFANVMQFMVNGSANMKDIVASGSGSAATALVNAASTILGSTLQPPPNTPATVNISNILQFAGGIVNIAATVATGGLVPPDLAGIIGETGSLIGGSLSASGNYVGGFTNPGQTYLPSPQYKVLTTIGELSNGALQQQLSIGFDTNLDSILGDWNKLSQIGPKVTNSNVPSYNAPNQVAQNTSVQLLGQAAQRSFYLSLLPSEYSVQLWPHWWHPYPDMGYVPSSGSGDDTCYAWYVWQGTNGNPLAGPPSGVGISYPSYAGSPIVWTYYSNPNPAYQDIFLLASTKAINPGKTSQSFQYIDQGTSNTLFNAPSGSTPGLNLPFDEVMNPVGPFASVFEDASQNDFYNFNSQNVRAPASCYNFNNDKNAVAVAPSSGGVTLSAPASVEVGESVTLQATVTFPNATPQGMVDFDEGSTTLGTAKLDSTGKASISINTLAVGTHTLHASFYNLPGSTTYPPSDSQPVTIAIYTPVPDISLSTSASSVNVSYGSTSSPITLNLASVGGMSGAINLSCSGLPVGMTCNFNPSQVTLAAGGQSTASFTITANAVAVSSFWTRGIGLLLLPLSLGSLIVVRRGRRNLQGLLCLLVLLLGGASLVTGCSGSGSAKSVQETGTKTVLVTATSGSVARTIPIQVVIQ